jgi:hypothetical protein
MMIAEPIPHSKAFTITNGNTIADRNSDTLSNDKSFSSGSAY